ncbi:unnamed protein product [Phytophthora fragariaefolia]|uniref:Unnamed protein product n=1 Tax=Phytophthora fragariaefolia TaxID=1490495 RepID=A0A9W6XFN9_9STRA|nr:unnamed protein product [Phytophthora fragariaefolia]
MIVPSRFETHGGAAVAPIPEDNGIMNKVTLSDDVEGGPGSESTCSRDDQPLLRTSDDGDHDTKSEVDSSAASVNLSSWSMKRVEGLAFIVFAAFNFSVASVCGYVVLKESIDRIDFAAAIMAFLGALFVTRPAFLFGMAGDATKAPILAVFCALGGAMTQAVVYVTLRKLHAVDHLTAIHCFFAFGTIASALTILFMGVAVKIPMNAAFLFSVFGSGFFSFIGQIFLTKGFQIEKAGIASVMRYFDVIFVVVMDIIVLGEQVNALSIVGAVIIMSGASLIVLRKAYKK